MIVDAACYEGRHEARDAVDRLLLQKELRVVMANRRFNCGRAVDHHDSETDKRNHEARENRVHWPRRAIWVRLRIERRGELDARIAFATRHAKVSQVDHDVASARCSKTARTNSSPRCL
jgi:hypothetical protein